MKRFITGTLISAGLSMLFWQICLIIISKLESFGLNLIFFFGMLSGILLYKIMEKVFQKEDNRDEEEEEENLTNNN